MNTKLMPTTLLALSCACLLAVSLAVPAAASGAAVLAPTAGDLVPMALTAPAAGANGPEVSREPVDFSWALDPSQPLDDRPSRFTSTSKGYWLDVSAEDLRRGVSLATVAPGAVVRINPAPGSPATSIAPEALEPRNLVVVKGEQRLGGAEAMELLVSAEEMAAAELPFAPGTTAFRLKASLGSGSFLLEAPALAETAGRFVVHVQEPASDLVLALRVNRPHYLHGQGLRVTLKLSGGSEPATASTIRAFVLSPAGRSFPVAFRPAGGEYRGSLRLDTQEPYAEGLWELQAAVEGRLGEQTLRRGGRTAFQVALPTARLEGTAEITRPEGGLAVRLGVETAAAGRYEVRGVLYGTGADGGLKPFAIGHSAAWLPARRGDVTLTFPKELIQGSGLRAPFEIRDLRLLDQGRMALVQRQERGLVIP